MRAMIVSFLLGGCSSVEPESFVFVHGAFQDASSWDDVIPELERQGHRAVAVELPGRNGDSTPHATLGLTDYVEAISTAIEPIGEPVVLVGHSFGGISISAFAERSPEQVARLVYLAAYLPVNGDSLAGLAEQDKDNGFNDENFLVNQDFTTASVLEADRLGIFCQECTDAQGQRLLSAFHDEPLAPMSTPVQVTADGLGRVTKTYVFTRDDKAISPALQKAMVGRSPVDLTVELGGGHVPFLTRPNEVVDTVTARPEPRSAQ